jgi:putative DNA primase/helicase
VTAEAMSELSAELEEIRGVEEILRSGLNGSEPVVDEHQERPVPLPPAEPTDLGNAQRFAAIHSNRLRFVPGWRRWHVWTRGRWRVDETGEAKRAAKEIARRLLVDAAQLEHEEERKRAVRWAVATQAEQRLRAMLTVAESEPVLVLAADQLDADPWLLGCANGTIDLSSGALHPHDPAQLISLGSEIIFDPNARCPRWLRFLDEIFAGDQELIDFVQRAAGYSLTGDVREHVLFVLHGAGANGKSTLVEILQRLLGGLARTSAFESFTRTRDKGTRNDLARLQRARMVVASESGEGRRLDEATVKTLTGGDTIAARFLYGEYFEFRPEFKLWLVTNHRPRVDGDDDAIWRRLRLIPFEVSFVGREDRELRHALETELPGILAWAVQRCLAWQRDGLGLAGAVESATREYREDEDVLGAFIDERCELGLSLEVEAGALRESYEAFCKSLGERPLAASALGRRLLAAACAPQGIRRKPLLPWDRTEELVVSEWQMWQMWHQIQQLLYSRAREGELPELLPLPPLLPLRIPRPYPRGFGLRTRRRGDLRADRKHDHREPAIGSPSASSHPPLADGSCSICTHAVRAR